MVVRGDSVLPIATHHHPKNSIFVFRSSSITQSEVRSEVVVEQHYSPHKDGAPYSATYDNSDRQNHGSIASGDHPPHPGDIDEDSSYLTTMTEYPTAPPSPGVQRVRSNLRRRTNTLPPSEPTTVTSRNADDHRVHPVASMGNSSSGGGGDIVVGHSTNSDRNNKNTPSTRSLADRILDRANRTVSPIRVGYRFKQHNSRQ